VSAAPSTDRAAAAVITLPRSSNVAGREQSLSRYTGLPLPAITARISRTFFAILSVALAAGPLHKYKLGGQQVLSLLVLVGIAGLAVGLLGARASHRRIRLLGLSWWRLQLLPVAVGIGASVLLAFRHYRASQTTEVLGIPFPMAAFENGHDFVGITSLPLALANVVFFLLLPQAALAIYLRSRASR
jgi:hypothetical protein